MTSILFWNCRGARKKATGHYLKTIIAECNPFFLGLVETRVTSFTRKDIDIMAGKRWEFAFQPSAGISGGILIMWRSDLLSFTISAQSNQAICGIASLPGDVTWHVGTIYASNDICTRRELWDLLTSFCNPDVKVCIGGDFNCIANPEDKKGGKAFQLNAGVKDLLNFMSAGDLHDPGFTGPRYTWCNNKDGVSRIWVRHDRTLLNSLALQCIPLATTKHLLRLASDHCPICIDIRPTPFPREKLLRFEDMWLSYPAVWDLVHKCWLKHDSGSKADILQTKCKRTIKAFHYRSKH